VLCQNGNNLLKLLLKVNIHKNLVPSIKHFGEEVLLYLILEWVDRNSNWWGRWRRNCRGSRYYLTVIIWGIRGIVVFTAMRIEIIPIFGDINIVVGNFDAGDRNSRGWRRGRGDCGRSCYYLTLMIWCIGVIVVFPTMRIKIILIFRDINTVISNINAGVIRKIII